MISSVLRFIVLIVLLPNPDGGLYPIGLFPSPMRVWMRARLNVAREWEACNDFAALFGGVFLGFELLLKMLPLALQMVEATARREAEAVKRAARMPLIPEGTRVHTKLSPREGRSTSPDPTFCEGVSKSKATTTTIRNSSPPPCRRSAAGWPQASGLHTRVTAPRVVASSSSGPR